MSEPRAPAGASSTIILPPEALEELPLFPLPSGVLLPRTAMSLHIFEPRYRRMIADVMEGHRVLAIAMVDDEREPDRFGRPAIHPVAGVGIVRRSARLPDGRYNIVVEGVLRADVSVELPPELPYRRARARRLLDEAPSDPRGLDAPVAALRSLCARVVAELSEADADLMQKLNEVSDPGALADLVAAAAVQDPLDRQRILAAIAVEQRVDLAAAALGALLLQAHADDDDDDEEGTGYGWGIAPGKA